MKKMKSDSRIDLTEGPIFETLIRLALPVTIAMVMFTVYLMVDLYFVGRLGPDAVAAVSISGNAFFIHLGFSTILGTGGMALIAQAFGRKDYDYAATVFKQSILLALIVGVIEAATGLMIAPVYIKYFGGSGKSLEWGIQYFQIFVISFLFMILLFTVGNCYRGMGNTKTPMIIMLQANLMNIVLDPILIFGWLGLPALGVRGAALASIISQLYALAIYGYLIFIKGAHIDLKGKWQLRFSIIRKSLFIGIPSGLVFTLPVYFSWGIQSIWWIKLTTAVLEMVVVALWLKAELQRTRLRISGTLQTAG
jgi:putative MATE family efflux protein